MSRGDARDVRLPNFLTGGVRDVQLLRSLMNGARDVRLPNFLRDACVLRGDGGAALPEQ